MSGSSKKPLSDTEKLNKVVRVLNLIFVEMGWESYWASASKFVAANQGKILKLYDVIVEVVESG